MKHARADYDHIQDPSGKIANDEPVFLLRAKDRTAPQILNEWARLQRFFGGDEQLAQMADEHAARMRAWQAVNGCKLADL